MFGLKPANYFRARCMVGSAVTTKRLRVLTPSLVWGLTKETHSKLGGIFHQKAIGWVLRVVIIMACLVSVTACGYRFAGSGGPPQGVEKLFIELIENKTTESGVDILITNGLKNEFIQKYRGVLVDREVATAVLSGAVVGIRTETVARRGALTSLERRVYMTIDLTMKSSHRERIWFTKGITTSDTFTVVSGDKEATEQNKRITLQDLARRIAEISFNRLTDDF